MANGMTRHKVSCLSRIRLFVFVFNTLECCRVLSAPSPQNGAEQQILAKTIFLAEICYSATDFYSGQFSIKLVFLPLKIFPCQNLFEFSFIHFRGENQPFCVKNRIFWAQTNLESVIFLGFGCHRQPNILHSTPQNLRFPRSRALVRLKKFLQKIRNTYAQKQPTQRELFSVFLLKIHTTSFLRFLTDKVIYLK